VRDLVVDLYIDYGVSMAKSVDAVLTVLDAAGIARPNRIPNSYHLTVRAVGERSLVEQRALAMELANSTLSFGWRWDSTTNYAARSFFAGSVCFQDANGNDCQEAASGRAGRLTRHSSCHDAL
jgi:hypothetical protein